MIAVNPDERTQDLSTAIFFNLILPISFLLPHWLVLAFLVVVILETVVFYCFWKDIGLSVEVAFMGNAISSLIAVPLLLSGSSSFSSVWFNIIDLGASFVRPIGYGGGFVEKILWILFFIPPLVLSVLIELGVWKKFNHKSEKGNGNLPVIIANIASYSVIFLSLLFLGIWYGLTYPEGDYPNSYFEGRLFYPITADTNEILTGLFEFLFGVNFYLSWVMLLVFVIYIGIWVYQKIKIQKSDQIDVPVKVDNA